MGFYTESAKQMINPMDVPTFMIECAQSERKLFEGLIELDFAEVYCESGLAFLTEEETKAAEDTAKKSIGTVLAEAWHKFTEGIKNIFNTIKDKLTEFANNASALLKKNNILDNPKIKECNEKVVWFKDYYDYVLGNAEKTLYSLASKSSESEKEEGFKKLRDDLNNRISQVSMEPVEGNTPVPAKLVKDCDMAELKKALGPGGIGSSLQAIFNALSKKDFSSEPSNEEAQKIKATLSYKLAFFSAVTRILSNTATLAKKNFTVIATFVGSDKKEASKEEKTGESAIYAALSDIYCESLFMEY